MKMKVNPIFIALLFLPLMSISCFYGIKGNGKVVKSERMVVKFESVDVSAGLELYLIQDSVCKVVVEADENLQEVIKTEVSNGELKIFPKTSIRHAASKKIFVTINSIHSLDASSGSEVRSKTGLKLQTLDISVSSGADVKIELSAKKLGIDCSSGGNVDISGTAEILEVDGSSGANIMASNLQANFCNAGASSGANLKITVSEKITANASSGGQIQVAGNPKDRNIEKSSGGDVSFR